MGKLLGICGLEGSGKSTSITAINKTFTDVDKTVCNTRMPGGTPIAEAIREIHKGEWGNETFSKVTELLLMFGSHEQLYRNVIIPSLNNFDVVLTDRLWCCTYAYQVHNTSEPTLEDLYHSLMKTVVSPTPHNDILWLDVDPAIGIERARGRGELDRIEKQGLDFFYNAQSAYRSLLETRTDITRIDANRNIQFVQKDVKEWAGSIVPTLINNLDGQTIGSGSSNRPY